MPCRDENFEMFKILVTTEFSDRVVKYARTVREFVVDSSWQCGIMRANAHHVTTVTKSSRTAHVEFTSSSRYVHELVCVAVWPCLLTHMIACTSRVDVTSCSRLVYAPHEQFVHDTSSSRRIHKQFMSSSRLLSDSCNRVDAAHQALYVGKRSKFCFKQRHDVTLFQRIMAAGGYIRFLDTARHFTTYNTFTFRNFSFFVFVSYGYLSMIHKLT